MLKVWMPLTEVDYLRMRAAERVALALPRTLLSMRAKPAPLFQPEVPLTSMLAAVEAQPFTGLPITTKGKQSRRTSHEKVRNEVFMSSVQIDNNWQRIRINAEDFFPKLSGVF